MISGSGIESILSVGRTQVQMFSGGTGPPLLFLHDGAGNPGWLPFHEKLAQRYTVYVPSMPGFNNTEWPDWVNSITDVAHFNQEMVQNLGFGQYILMGVSMGGWIAAEMAAMCQHDIKGLILVGPSGIRPRKGEIAEVFMVSDKIRLKQRFYDPSQVPDYENYTRELTSEERLLGYFNWEMASRLCWRPYQHNPSLPYYLQKVTTRTLIVWGRQDAIMPLECGELYHDLLSNAVLRVIDRCGHSPALEKPAEFLDVVSDFLSGLD
jgi:pimeloyl-ACP methyl ester carboxylesterase